jgi:hypothetical protein
LVLLKFVITGLVPVIHAFYDTGTDRGGPMVAGSSPAMTKG